MKRIVWLTSYVKSGNTWTRSFLTSLLYKERNEEDTIKNLIGPIFSARNWLEEYMLVESSELTYDEIEAYTPMAFREIAKSTDLSPLFFKVHDAYVHTAAQIPLFPADVSLGAIYIVRNPLDVAVSYAHHDNTTIDRSIAKMANENNILLADIKTTHPQVRQRVLSWSMHVRSWLEQKEIPVLCVRYEDMVLNPFDAFKKMVVYSGLSYADAEIEAAIEKNTFDKLKGLEQKYGFQEKKARSESFFRKGKIGSWRESLTDEQAQRIIKDHSVVMLQLGYLDAEGNPLY